jgi:hypothetical protein
MRTSSCRVVGLKTSLGYGRTYGRTRPTPASPADSSGRRPRSAKNRNDPSPPLQPARLTNPAPTTPSLDGQRRDYYTRQLHDWKGGAQVETFRVPGATLYSELCGATLARAHARWGDRIAIASYLGKGDAFDRAIADFSAVYADQNERDYNAFVDAVNTGRITAETGL